MSEPKTVRVRIAVAVTSEGKWTAGGDDLADPVSLRRVCLEILSVFRRPTVVHWIEADVPLPLEPQTIQGTVVSSEGE